MPDATRTTKVYFDQGGNREVVAFGGILLFENGAVELTQSGVGAIVPATGLALTNERRGTVHRTQLTLTAVPIATVDHTTNGAQGTLPLYTFPRGDILVLGSTMNLTTVGDGTGITTTSALVGAIGSVVPATDTTLTSTEADFVTSTTGTLVASAGAFHGLSAASKLFDNTTNTNATQLAANLNIATPDAGSTANGTVTVSGTIELCWINLGDN